MKEKAVIFLLVLLFAFISSTTAVPSSRSLKLNSDEHTSNYQFQEKNRRMDIEVTDYSGTGANNHHDPRTPPGSF